MTECKECGYIIEYTIGGNWNYCPMCGKKSLR